MTDRYRQLMRHLVDTMEQHAQCIDDECVDVRTLAAQRAAELINQQPTEAK